MASVQDYKRRIRSVRNTRKITRAMELVAAAKLRRAQSRIESMRPYAETMRELIAGVGRAAGSVRGLPLLQQRETTSATAARAADRRPRARGRVQRAGDAAGVRARPRAHGGGSDGALARRRQEGALDAHASGGASSPAPSSGSRDAPAYSDAQAIAHRAAELFVEGEVDRVVLVYNTFVSALTQTVTEQEILPIAADVLETDEDERRDDALRGDFIFEPEPEQILERLLPVYVETQIYRALLESSASEQGARMTAMRNASKNAGEMIDTPLARDEPRPPGRDHPGDPRGRGRRRRARLIAPHGTRPAIGCAERSADALRQFRGEARHIANASVREQS